MNANVDLSGGVVLKEEREIPVKNEVVTTVNVFRNLNINTTTEIVSTPRSTLNQNLIEELNSKIASLNEEKGKIIQQLIMVKSENQRLYLNVMKKDSAIESLRSQIKEGEMLRKLSELRNKNEMNEFHTNSVRLQGENIVLTAKIQQLEGALASVRDPNPSDTDFSQVYIVQGIINHRIVNQMREYRVRWEGYGLKDDTWEPERNLRKLTAYTNYVNKHFK